MYMYMYMCMCFVRVARIEADVERDRGLVLEAGRVVVAVAVGARREDDAVALGRARAVDERRAVERLGGKGVRRWPTF